MSEIEYQNYISNFWNKNNQEIENICKKSIKNTEYQWEDLYSECYLYLIDNQQKIENLVEIESKDRPLMRYIAQWCYNNLRLFNANTGPSNFKGKFKSMSQELNKQSKKDITEFDTINEFICQVTIHKYEEMDLTYLKSLQKIDNVINKLDEIDKKLYQLFHQEQLNFHKISKRLDISVYMVKKLINKMNDNIKQLIKQEFND